MDPKYLVLVTGLPGTGKSTISKVISQGLGWDLHTILDARMEMGYDHYDPHKPLFGYARLVTNMNISMMEGRNVVVDAVASYQCTRWALFSWAQNHLHKFLILECKCPSEVSISRMGRRPNKDASLIDDPADESVYWKCVAKYQDLDRFVRNHEVQLLRYLSYQNIFLREKIDSAGLPLVERIEDIVTKHFK